MTRWLVLLLALSAAGQEQATVTIYSPKITALGPVILKMGAAKGAEAGVGSIYLYDGSTLVGRWRGRTFLTIRVPAGKHTMVGYFRKGDISKKHPPKPMMPAVEFNFAPGEHAFLRMVGRRSGFYVVQMYHVDLRQTTCEEAQQERNEVEPVRGKQVFWPMRDVVEQVYFPSCDAKQTPATP